MSCFFLQLESIAASISPQDAVRELCKIAQRLELIIHSEINDIEVIAYPDVNPEELVRAWEYAMDNEQTACVA